jgi:hypothetical protein
MRQHHTKPKICSCCGQIEAESARNAATAHLLLIDLFFHSDPDWIRDVLDDLFECFIESSLCDAISREERAEFYHTVQNLINTISQLKEVVPHFH